MTRLLLLLALAQPPGRVLIYRSDLWYINGVYPAITDGPVLCGNRLLARGTDYWIEGPQMRVNCPPTERVSTFLAAWVEMTATPGPKPVERRKP